MKFQIFEQQKMPENMVPKKTQIVFNYGVPISFALIEVHQTQIFGCACLKRKCYSLLDSVQ